MDLSQLIEMMLAPFQNNRPLTIATVVLIVLLFYRKTKLAFIILAIAVVLLGVVLLISNVGTMGGTYKGRMTETGRISD